MASPLYELITEAYAHGDDKQGDMLLQQGVTNNDAWSLYLMGFKYENGRGVPMGFKYENGRGVPVDHAEAVKWHLRAAAQGHWQSSYDLGLAYENGIGVEKSLPDAIKWYRLSVKQGYPGRDAQAAVDRLTGLAEY